MLLSEELNAQVAREIAVPVIESVREYIKNHDKQPSRALPIIPQKQVIDELAISYQTLTEWEDKGLKRYGRGKKIFYRTSDIEQFLAIK